MSGPLSDERELERSKQRQRVQRTQVVADLRAVMGSAAGRRALANIIDATGVDGKSFAGEATHETAFHEGRRSVGMLIRSTLQQHAPELYVQMVAEQLASRELQPPAREPEEDE